VPLRAFKSPSPDFPRWSSATATSALLSLPCSGRRSIFEFDHHDRCRTAGTAGSLSSISLPAQPAATPIPRATEPDDLEIVVRRSCNDYAAWRDECATTLIIRHAVFGIIRAFPGNAARSAGFIHASRPNTVPSCRLCRSAPRPPDRRSPARAWILRCARRESWRGRAPRS